MTDEQQRVIDEKEELDDKLAALREFMTTDTWKELDVQDQCLLGQQLIAMSEYSIIIGRRIERSPVVCGRGLKRL